MKIRNLTIISYIIISLFHLTMLKTLASEEQIYRNELDAHQHESRLSHQEYHTELEKLLKPRPIQRFNLNNLLLPLGVIAIGIVLVFFIKQIRLNLISEVRENEIVIVEETVRTEKAALAHAEIAEESNDFREALRYLYLSAVLHLQERGILPYDKSLTNREYLYQTDVDDNLQRTLGPAVSVFDEVWYGHKPCNAETVANYRELLQQVYNNG